MLYALLFAGILLDCILTTTTLPAECGLYYAANAIAASACSKRTLHSCAGQLTILQHTKRYQSRDSNRLSHLPNLLFKLELARYDAQK